MPKIASSAWKNKPYEFIVLDKLAVNYFSTPSLGSPGRVQLHRMRCTKLIENFRKRVGEDSEL